ncbi:LOW QUALITY PROTEIN: acyl-CoA dehydrogenase family member 11 [Bombina bombina]|uniref:LOW QUALITY PROTEIN: acyl-CoA dehydrogenase family member 11 n=1 Tax=Bombina bombina TaxID=8345 RepID=UPI00235A7D33|nr:LOW QUALITY PROTEIN: acyl-CoA dehydrogenase family member 11 [Bombina bombina]
MAEQEKDTSAVRENHRFDERTLDLYLYNHLHGYSSESFAALVVRQYRSGQSNPTFFLQKGDKKYVLRKKPHGPLLPGAHRIEREYQVQTALFAAGFPVPKPLLYCTNVSVIGTEFYVMEHVQGRIFRDVSLPDVSPAERAALYVALAETLSQLHSFNIHKLNLSGYGKGEGYCQRQVTTWKKQYERAAHTDIPAMTQLADWLINHLPSNDNEETLIHGDFRIDNIIFHPTETRVIAVLDWELSTIGHPMSDLAYFTSLYFWPTKVRFFGQPSDKIFNDIEGMPAFEDLMDIYARCKGISLPVPDWNFFLALTFFKVAGILQGVHARFLIGNSSAENASVFAEMIQPLAENGLKLAKREINPLNTSGASGGELFLQSAKGQKVLQQVKQFMQQQIFPAQQEVLDYYTKHENSPKRWKTPPIIEKLKEMAKSEGLWNLFLPSVSGLSQTDYAFIAEETGKRFFAPEIFNCQAPDTGNMEVLHMYGTEEQKRQWLEPLLAGQIRSCFCMTEPDVASSDATNMECSIMRDGNVYVINGKKWWSSGAGNADCKVAIVMGKTEKASSSRYRQHSMIIVPMETKGVDIVRALKVFGYEDTPHGGHFEVHFNNVRVPVTNLILGEGRGFEIAQGRLGPGRIHHCMRTIGAAETALQLMCARAAQRKTFGKKLYHHEVVAHWIAESRIAIEQARLLTLKAARMIDTFGTARARKEIAMIKIAAPRMACEVADRAIQVFGGAGVSQDFPLAFMYAALRTLRIADGPDEVHLSAVAKMELLDQSKQLSAKM